MNSEEQTEKQMKIIYNIKLPIMFFAGCISMFSGNGIGWIILHFLFGEFYVAYKFAEIIWGGN